MLKFLALTLLTALCPLAPPAMAQQETRVVVVVAPGEALVLMREALDQAMRLHPGATPTQFLLSYNDAPPWPPNVGASYFPPLKVVGNAVIVTKGDNRHYNADVTDGRVGVLSEDHEQEPVPVDETAIVEEDIPFTVLLVDGEDLAVIETAWTKLRAVYAETPPLGDLIVSYTRNATPGIGYDANLTYVVFTHTGHPADSYSVFINGANVRTYRGIAGAGNLCVTRPGRSRLAQPTRAECLDDRVLSRWPCTRGVSRCLPHARLDHFPRRPSPRRHARL